jgi:signal transduction histidine kinase
MSVMVVQADAASHGVADPEAREALQAIEATGRESLREMRRLVGLLRDEGGDGNGLAPQPGIAELPALFESVRSTGLPVDLVTEGVPVALAPGVDLAVFRIVQEALTNTMRHAGPARATVRLTYEHAAIAVEIDDTGRGGSPSTAGGGKGLIGMRERARLYGGSVEAAPGPAGFAVRARLPVDGERR